MIYNGYGQLQTKSGIYDAPRVRYLRLQTVGRLVFGPAHVVKICTPDYGVLWPDQVVKHHALSLVMSYERVLGSARYWIRIAHILLPSFWHNSHWLCSSRCVWDSNERWFRPYVLRIRYWILDVWIKFKYFEIKLNEYYIENYWYWL